MNVSKCEQNSFVALFKPDLKSSYLQNDSSSKNFVYYEILIFYFKKVTELEGYS